MGGRMMKRWMVLPLKELKIIESRLDAVNALIKNEELAFELSQRLGNIYDLERLASKIAVGKVNPKEVNQLKNTLLELAPIQQLLKKTNSKALLSIADRMNPCEQLIRSEEHTSELQSRPHLVCRLLLEKKKN